MRTVTAKMELGLHRRGTDGYVVEVRFIPPGGDVEIDMLRDSSVPVVIDHEALLRHALSPDDYGHTLTQALFGDRSSPLSAAYREAQLVAAQERAPLHLQLFIGSTAPELHAIRWETLRDPVHRYPLFTGEHVTFARYLSSTSLNYAGLRPRGNLRALVVIADTPSGRFNLARINTDQEQRIATAGLGTITPTILSGPGNLNLSTILRHIRDGYDIFYLVAHGTLKRGEEQTEGPYLQSEVPHLWLEKQPGEGAWISANTFIEQLARAAVLPRLAVLVSCQSAGTGTQDEDSIAMRQSLGPQLALIGIPSVIAMQGNLTLTTAERFFPTFFRELQCDGQIERALSVARGDVRDRPDWWMPVLFTRLRHGRLWLDNQAQVPPLDVSEIRLGLERLERLAPLHGSSLEADANRIIPAMRALLAESTIDAEQQTILRGDLDRITAAIIAQDFSQLARAPHIEVATPVPPFPGLHPFRRDDLRFFKGREDVVQRMVDRLNQQSFLAVIGKSGCGKSSLVFAGVIPALEDLRSGEVLHVVSFKPSHNPLAQWAAARTHISGEPDLIVVDQFEELFTLCQDEHERRLFIEHLLATCSTCKVIVTMRTDFLHECMDYPDLYQMLLQYQEPIYAMTPAELQRAIELQAQEGRVVFEHGLTQLILDDVTGEPGAMPLLQHALQEVWKRRYGRWLRMSDYQACGMVRGAIAQTADSFYLSLDPQQRGLMRHIFTRLTRLDSDYTTGERRDTRQRLRLSDLVTDEAPEPPLRTLIDRLATARLLVTSAVLQGDSYVIEVEVAHEALIRHWPQLREWLTSGRSDRLFEQTIKSAALEWENSAFDPTLIVHRGRRIQQAQRLITERRISASALERRYVAACVEANKQEQPLKFLDLMRWAVIVNALEDTAILKALTPLIRHRAAEQGITLNLEHLHFRDGENCGAWYKRICNEPAHHRDYWFSLPPVLIYRPGERARSFLSRHGVSMGPAEPMRLPYYLLIVGKPGPRAEGDENYIPFTFQYTLDVQYGVGRLHFEEHSAYERYSESVIASERSDLRLPRKIALFGTRHELDRATELSHDLLLQPLAVRLQTLLPGWTIQANLAVAATRNRLLELLGGSDTPALFFSASHGLGLPLTDDRQEAHQGALVTHDWEGLGSVKRTHWFAAEDITPHPRFLGSMAFFWNCYSAGCPERDEFVFDERKGRQQIAPYAFIARLPQVLLSHPTGGMLAVIGKIERAWTYSFSEGQNSTIGIFTTTIQRLLDGYPIGSALEPFNARYSAVAVELVDQLEQIREGQSADLIGINQLWMQNNDARNYVIIGDPATRLAIGDTMEQTQRAALSDLLAALPARDHAISS